MIMLTTNLKLSMVANLAIMASIWRGNSNSLREIEYKASVAGVQTIHGPLWPEKRNYVYEVGDYYLFPVWSHLPDEQKATYIICDLNGLPLTDTEYNDVVRRLGF